jgi:NADPH2:quinone reductase
MKAWQVSERCEPEQMKLADTPVSDPRSGEVRIRNHAAALNFFDILQIQGKYQTKPPLPFTPGAEVAGVIDAVGPDVDHLSAGDRVSASQPRSPGQGIQADLKLKRPLACSLSN